MCKKPGHLSWQCPTRDSNPPAPVKARVYTLDAEEAARSDDLIQATGKIDCKSVKLFSDSSATHFMYASNSASECQCGNIYVSMFE